MLPHETNPSRFIIPPGYTIDATNALVEAVASLRPGQHLVDAKGEWLASHGADAAESVVFADLALLMRRPFDLFSANAGVLEADFDLLTRGRSSATLSSTNTLIGDRIFAEPGALAEASVLNSRTGAIYLAARSEIMEGSLVRGALALCEGSQDFDLIARPTDAILPVL